MKNRSFVRAVALLLVILMLGGVLMQFISLLLSAVAADDEIDALQQRIDTLAKERSRLDRQEQTAQQKLRAQMDQKSALEQDINILGADIDEYTVRIAGLAEEIAAAEMEIELLQLQVDAKTTLYLLQIREIHEVGPSGMLDVFFGATSLTDFLTRTDRAEALALFQEEVIQALKTDKQVVLELKASIEFNKANQEELRAQVQSKRNEMQGMQNEVNSIIKDAQGDLAELSKLIEANEAEEEKLQREIKRLLAARRSAWMGTGEFIWPTPGYSRTTDEFGMREHPVTKKWKLHSGMDIAAKGGTSVLASNSGEVIVSEYNSSWGNYCVIDHGNGIATLYAHMQKAASVKVGDMVAKGEQIGIVGSTGLSTGNHLHFEFRLNGDPVDPYQYVSKP